MTEDPQTMIDKLTTQIAQLESRLAQATEDRRVLLGRAEAAEKEVERLSKEANDARQAAKLTP